MRLEDVIPVLKPVFEDENVKKTTYDAKTEVNVLRTCDVHAEGIIFDIALASYVKDPNRKHELEIQALENLNHAVSSYAPFEKEKKKQPKFEDSAIDAVLNYVADEEAVILDLTKYWIQTAKLISGMMKML